MQRFNPFSSLLALLSLTFAVQPAKADTLSFTGNLKTDATVTSCGLGCTLGPADSVYDYVQYAAVVRSFTLGTASPVSATTFGYGGGVNGAGTTVAQSGFEPYLSLFDAAGHFLSSTYFGTACPAGAKTNTALGGCYDVRLDAGTLAAGTYQIAITASENFSFAENYGSGNLSDGFIGLGNLYSGEDLHYAFDVTYAASTTTPPVPEPASGLLVGLGMSVLGLVRKQLYRRN